MYIHVSVCVCPLPVCYVLCMWLCSLSLCTNTELWLENTALQIPLAPNIVTVCIPPMITHWERKSKRDALAKREEDIQWLLTCIKPVYMCGTIRYYSSTPCMGHGSVAWFTAHRKPHWFWLLRVCGLPPAFLKDTWTHAQHQASNEELRQESFTLQWTAHIFLFPFSLSLFRSPSLPIPLSACLSFPFFCSFYLPWL